MPDIREYLDENEETLRTLVDSVKSQMWHAMPCIITEDSDGHTLKAQPAIQGQYTDKNGKTQKVNMQELQDIPVHQKSGGGFTLTHPIKKGDEALVVFSSRPIDTWFQSGGTNNKPIDNRQHSLSDGFAFVGFRSNPRKLSPAPSTTSTQLRSDDGRTYVDVSPTKVTCVAPDEVLLKNPDGTLVSVTPGRVDLGDYHGSKVLTVAGPSKKVYAVV